MSRPAKSKRRITKLERCCAWVSRQRRIVTTTEVAQAMQVHTSAAAGLLCRLASDGYITKTSPHTKAGIYSQPSRWKAVPGALTKMRQR